MLQSRPATDSMAKMTKTQKDFPDTEVVRRWGKPCRLVEEQNLENRLILGLVLVTQLFVLLYLLYIVYLWP